MLIFEVYQKVTVKGTFLNQTDTKVIGTITADSVEEANRILSTIQNETTIYIVPQL